MFNSAVAWIVHAIDSHACRCNQMTACKSILQCKLQLNSLLVIVNLVGCMQYTLTEYVVGIMLVCYFKQSHVKCVRCKNMNNRPWVIN